MGGRSGRRVSGALGLCREATAPTRGRCGVSITVGHRGASCVTVVEALGRTARGYRKGSAAVATDREYWMRQKRKRKDGHVYTNRFAGSFGRSN